MKNPHVFHERFIAFNEGWIVFHEESSGISRWINSFSKTLNNNSITVEASYQK